MPAEAEPEAYLEVSDGRVLVTGTYVGAARQTGKPVRARFMHLLSFADGKICALEQLTDSQQWVSALNLPTRSRYTSPTARSHGRRARGGPVPSRPGGTPGQNHSGPVRHHGIGELVLCARVGRRVRWCLI